MKINGYNTVDVVKLELSPRHSNIAADSKCDDTVSSQRDRPQHHDAKPA